MNVFEAAQDKGFEVRGGEGWLLLRLLAGYDVGFEDGGETGDGEAVVGVEDDDGVAGAVECDVGVGLGKDGVDGREIKEVRLAAAGGCGSELNNGGLGFMFPGSQLSWTMVWWRARAVGDMVLSCDCRVLEGVEEAVEGWDTDL